jgi:hypothetical protein
VPHAPSETSTLPRLTSSEIRAFAMTAPCFSERAYIR